MFYSAAFALASVSHAEDWSKIRIGVEGAYPPFSSVTADGQLVGFDIDIANALCEEMGAECEMIQQDWGWHYSRVVGEKIRRYYCVHVHHRRT